MNIRGYIIIITGLVQGIGFRPFIYRIAKELAMPGSVENDSQGVIINVDTTPQLLDLFLSRIRSEAPAVSSIIDIKVNEVQISNFVDFKIVKSVNSLGNTQVSPDIAICDACLDDRHKQPHRLQYPFINCTHCGPRFSIIKNVPYDRPSTTMNEFVMCDRCNAEYKAPDNRRFHAQPIACNNCGPTYSYYNGLQVSNDYSIILKTLVKDIEQGKIVAMKSIGGFNLICDATNIDTLNKLREIKNRPRKPFAIMVANVERVLELAELNDTEMKTLISPQRPIVILDLKKESNICDIIAPLYRTIGIMLPYMAIHYDIFENSKLKQLVVTSGNEGGNPIIIDNETAITNFSKLNIPILTYNREIYNRVDDSVVQVIDNRVRIIRRARGYIPNPIFNSENTNGIIGMGAEIISHFAIGCGNQIIESQYIGSLSNYGNELFYNDTLQRFRAMYNFNPRLVVVDAHYQYRASIIGEDIAQKDIPLIKMWHHHAHAVAVMAEYNLHDYNLAICLDGTGLGTDNSAWGGELLLCNRTLFTRLYHLQPVAMPGGDAASFEGWRMAVAVVGDIKKLPRSFIERIGTDRITLIENMIKNNFNSPYSSGAGRLFDAVASLLNISDVNTYEAEAPILLEQIADTSNTEIYNDCSYRGIIDSILCDIENGVPYSIISSRFHNSFVEMWIQVIVEYATKMSVSKIILCGGVFQNRLLATLFITKIRNLSLIPYFASQIPCNDAAIPIGQVAFGAEYLKQS